MAIGLKLFNPLCSSSLELLLKPSGAHAAGGTQPLWLHLTHACSSSPGFFQIHRRQKIFVGLQGVFDACLDLLDQ